MEVILSVADVLALDFVPVVGKQTKLTTQTAVVMTYGPECVGTINFN